MVKGRTVSILMGLLLTSLQTESEFAKKFANTATKPPTKLPKSVKGHNQEKNQCNFLERKRIIDSEDGHQVGNEKIFPAIH